MKVIASFLLWLAGITAALGILFFSYVYIQDIQVNGFKTILSPIPQIVEKSLASNSKNTYQYWRPSTTRIVPFKIEEPKLSALSALSYDLSSDTLLYSKNTTQQMPMASLTKIMTAIVVAENMDMKSQITISKHAATIGENVMGLTEGEKVTVEDLLYGLILESGNDAAEALADGSPFGRDEFIHVMNARAEQLGIINTRFTNPSGLNGDGRQYTTAIDLLTMARYALSFPEIAKVSATLSYELPQSATHKAYSIPNLTNLMTSYPGVKGLKTGYTDEAGMCLVTYLEYKGHRIIGVLLNSADRRGEMKELLDYSLRSLGETPPKHS